MVPETDPPDKARKQFYIQSGGLPDLISRRDASMIEGIPSAMGPKMSISLQMTVPLEREGYLRNKKLCFVQSRGEHLTQNVQILALLFLLKRKANRGTAW